MANRTVALRLNEKEFEKLEQEAKEFLLSVQQLAKFRALGNNEFIVMWQKMVKLIKALPDNTEQFLPQALFLNGEWENLNHGTAIAIGKQLYKIVNSGDLPGITALPKRGSRQYYKKQ